jgi:hypothetical protein
VERGLAERREWDMCGGWRYDQNQCSDYSTSQFVALISA